VLENSDEKSINDWSIYFARGICFERINNWNLAEKDLLHALKLEPQQPDLLNYLGYSWIDRNKNLEEATQMVVAAVKARPNDPQIIDSMGWIFFKSQNYDMAAEYLEKAAEITPYDSVINDHLGDTYWKQGRHNEAIFQWKRALKYDARKDLSVIDVNNKIENGLDGLGNKS
jgi:Flp pilus assembly protein TadD